MAFDYARALDRLCANKAGKKALILPHDNPDPDSLAAALGLRKLLATRNIAVTVAQGGIIGRAENRAMVRELGIDIVPFHKVDLAEYGIYALVDTQPNTGNNSLPATVTADIVIDHHPARAESANVPWCDIRPEFGATTTIVYQYLKTAGLPIDAYLATSMLYAVKSETRDLGRESGHAEREAYIDLAELADFTKLHAITNPKLGREHFVAIDRALRNATVWGDLLAVNLGELDYPDLVAEVADLMLPYDKARWVLCVGVHEEHVYLSIRTDIPTAAAGLIIRRIVGARGAAGGHDMTAGGRLFSRVHNQSELKVTYDDLVARLNQELHISAAPIPLL